jgi:hypothetical protein
MIINIDSRLDFVESWLMEMPELMRDMDSYSTLVWTINDRLNSGHSPKEISPGVFKLSWTQVVSYWIGTADRIDIAAELSRQAQSLSVNLVGKDPNLKGKSPYASNLYGAILDDSEVSLVISDRQLSQHGSNIWRQLINQGYIVGAYDIKNPGQSYKRVENADELEKYLAKDKLYQLWRFVVSKTGMMLAETNGYFNTCRYRELAGILWAWIKRIEGLLQQQDQHFCKK